MSCLRRLLLVPLVVVTAAAQPLAASEPPPRDTEAAFSAQSAGGQVFLRGAGFGHQVGMSQYGAYAMALEGWSAADILSFYYQGSLVRTIEGGLGLIAVNVMSDSPTVTFLPLGRDGGGPHAEIRVGTITGPPLAHCHVDERCVIRATGGQVILEGSDPPIIGTRDQPIYVGIEDQEVGPVFVNLPFAESTYSHGHLRVLPTAADGDKLNVINVLDLEVEYVAGIAEVPSSWPAATLDAQAIAARTYAYQRHRGGACDCDVVDSVYDQVYAGWEKEKEAAWAAAAERTRGQVIFYGDEKVSAFYSSSSGGKTEANEDAFGGTPVPYLRSVDDPWSLTSLNPLRSWTRRFSDTEGASDLGVDRVLGITVTQRTQGGSIKRVLVSGVKAGQAVSIVKTGNELRYAYALPSTRAEIPGATFDEFLLLYNPNSFGAKATVRLLFPGGEQSLPFTLQIPAGARQTVRINDYAPFRDVSVSVSAESPIVAERAMYFTYQGRYAGGHASEGVTRAATRWLLAEGYVSPTFDTYVLVANPAEETATATLRLLGTDGRTVSSALALPPRSRSTVRLNDVVGNDFGDVSVEVTADGPVIAERSSYFNYAGLSGEERIIGGHNAPGVQEPALSWYLAEGYTGELFDTFLLIENPGDVEAHPLVTFLRPEGEPVVQAVTVPARSRYTIVVDRVPGLESGEVSVEVLSDEPVVAERSMYFDYQGRIDGHVAEGARSASPTWYLAEGFASPTFDTYVLVANPDPARAAEVDIEYHQAAGLTATRRLTVPPRSRRTVKVNDDVQGDVSTVVASKNGVPLVAERAVYFDYLGKKGGTAAMGVATPSTEWFFAEGYTGS